jgi:NAD(P)-dependent dehydrogenase (short-subunit alcohol dehydrogenase family)
MKAHYFLAATATAAATAVLLKPSVRYHLRGKNVIITGGSRGLGLVLAREFLRQGARVALLARDGAELKRARRELHAARSVLTEECDVTERKQITHAIDRVRRKLGPIHVLVNNAGIISVGPLDAATESDFRHSLDVHFWGAFHAAMAVLPEMRARHEGRIVNISSIGGKISVPHLLPYCVGKFALAGFSEGLRSELLRDGVHVTSVYPGLMRTGSPRNANFKGKHRAEYAWFSVSAALPVMSVSAQRAARQIVRASQHGKASLVISLPAKLAVGFHGLFPDTAAALLALASRELPAVGGIGSRTAKGQRSTSPVSPSWLTWLNERAARLNNEAA